MLADNVSREERELTDSLLRAYALHQRQIGLFRDQLVLALSTAEALAPYVHSFRSRLKDPEHLRDKVIRKFREAAAAGIPFDVTADNLLVKVNDLVGIRILHLHTSQIRNIDAALRALFEEQSYALIEGPFARTWDDESREFFRSCNIDTQVSPTMYTSVHYVVGSASRTQITAEIQVRTLMEEAWGETDHFINYPTPTESVACREQIRVLARVASSGTRLVDAIFVTIEDHKDKKRG